MIPRASITSWGASSAPWPTEDQVEQDLILSRPIIDIANSPAVGDQLALRGGTCLHKLRLDYPRRYSEDLDYVQAHEGPIGPVFDALRDIGETLGLETRTGEGRRPRLTFRGRLESGGPLRVKIEFNITDRPPARDYVGVEHGIDTDWFSGSADVMTYESAELVASKVRALYQRRKGRDLFDLWLALTALGVWSEEVVECFERYRPPGFTAKQAIRNLEEKVGHPEFASDLSPLVREWPEGYSIETAAQLVTAEILSHL